MTAPLTPRDLAAIVWGALTDLPPLPGAKLAIHPVRLPWGWSVEIVAEDEIPCPRCGVTVRRRGPVEWVDERTGDAQGAWSKEHGCGEWNTPVAERLTIDDGDPDAPRMVAELVAEVHREWTRCAGGAGR